MALVKNRYVQKESEIGISTPVGSDAIGWNRGQAFQRRWRPGGNLTACTSNEERLITVVKVKPSPVHGLGGRRDPALKLDAVRRPGLAGFQGQQVSTFDILF